MIIKEGGGAYTTWLLRKGEGLTLHVHVLLTLVS